MKLFLKPQRAKKGDDSILNPNQNSTSSFNSTFQCLNCCNPSLTGGYRSLHFPFFVGISLGSERSLPSGPSGRMSSLIYVT